MPTPDYEPPTSAEELLERYRLGDQTLNGALAPGAQLDGVVLKHADLARAVLRGAHLSSADLSGADLTNADLRSSHLARASLPGALLVSANLGRAFLRSADLSGADLTGATLAESVFIKTDLSAVEGLESVIHAAPSTLDHRTIARSGSLPRVFLAGIGLADWQIEESKLLQPDLVPSEITDIMCRAIELRGAYPLQVRPVFISYSHTDGAFVDTLEAELNGVGIRFWREIHELEAGPLEPQICRGQDDRVALVVLSEASLASGWVESEVEYAHEAASVDRPYTLCPIALDDAWKSSRWDPALRMALKKFHILDFSGWQALLLQGEECLGQVAHVPGRSQPRGHGATAS